MATIECEECGDAFNVTPSQAESRRFCSAECHNEWRTGRRRTEYVKLTCETCGEPFEIPPAWEKNGRRKYCSRECKDESQIGVTGEDHPRWGMRHSDESKRKMSENAYARGLKPWQHPTWSGGRFLDGRGYVHVLITALEGREKELAEAMWTGLYALEHRLVMAKERDRPLETDEVVHHVNGDKQDNRIENLEIYDRAAHSSEHRAIERRVTKLKAENRRLRSLLKTYLPDGESISDHTTT